MTSFNEGNINRDADGRFAATTTGETDTSAIGSSGESVSSMIDRGATNTTLSDGTPVRLERFDDGSRVMASAEDTLMVDASVSDDDLSAYLYHHTSSSKLKERHADGTATVTTRVPVSNEATMDDVEQDVLDDRAEIGTAASLASFVKGRAQARETFADEHDPKKAEAMLDHYSSHMASDDDADPKVFQGGFRGYGMGGYRSHPSYSAGATARRVFDKRGGN